MGSLISFSQLEIAASVVFIATDATNEIGIDTDDYHIPEVEYNIYYYSKSEPTDLEHKYWHGVAGNIKIWGEE